MASVPIANSSMLKPWAPPQQKDYLIINASIIDPRDGSIFRDMMVDLSNSLIRGIYSSDDRSFFGASGRNVIDLKGKYLCPGLIDCHVHIATPPGEDGLSATMTQDPTTGLLRQPWLLKQMLHRGFTTIRDCGGATLAMKEAVAEGLHPGPRLFISRHAISQTGGHGDPRAAKDPETVCCGAHSMEGIGKVADGVEQCLIAAREQIRQGADFLKIMCSGGVASPTDGLTSIQYTGEEVRAFTTVAESCGTYVTAHAYTPAAIKHAIENGVKAIEHGNLLDEATATLMKEKGVFLTPTLVTYDTMAAPEFRNFLPSGNKEKNMQVLEAGLSSIQIADRAGVTMCYGTDLLGPMQIRQAGEFGLRAKVLSPLKVLQSATVNAAKMLKMEGKLGRIVPGAFADLLVLDRNPLEDIEMFDRHQEAVLAVMKDGRVMMSRCSYLAVDV